MNILGLNFGHDAAACVIRDGEIASYVLRERLSRNKHDLGLTRGEIDRVLAEAGLSVKQIDLCAITSTQSVEIVVGLADGLSIDFERHPLDRTPAPFETVLAEHGVPVERLLGSSLDRVFSGKMEIPLLESLFKTVFPTGDRLATGELETVGWLDSYAMVPQWDPKGLADIGRVAAPLHPDLDRSFHYPVRVTLDGVSIPAAFVAHHMAHAASCFFRSGFETACVLTHDGYGSGTGYKSGFIGFGDGNRVKVLAPHHLVVGWTYHRMSYELGLSASGGPGKLMGLAPYGKPVFFDPRFVGNDVDVRRVADKAQAQAWLDHCLAAAKAAGYDRSALADPARITEPVNADIAASTQKLFEECYLETARAARRLLDATGLATDSLCLTGGAALNCPSNARLWREGPFDTVFVEPSCDDGGLPIGAALYLYHNVLDKPRKPMDGYATPYLGAPYADATVTEALAGFGDAVRVEKPVDPATAAANDLAADRVIAWFEGGSESGPRALGHRSILANPTHEANWKRVNRIKGREEWRPFAPAVLEEAAAEWFEGCPLPSPYMLFTASVRNDRLPAITHVDGSSRIQTVDPSCGGFHALLSAFAECTGIPVVMNTSFNGPGEPVVEHPREAIAFLLASDIDAVFVEGYRVTRA